jgi:hypothetical protein
MPVSTAMTCLKTELVAFTALLNYNMHSNVEKIDMAVLFDTCALLLLCFCSDIVIGGIVSDSRSGPLRPGNAEAYSPGMFTMLFGSAGYSQCARHTFFGW